MSGGIAVAEHLLCWVATDARGRVVLLDLDDQARVAQWEFGGDGAGYADAAGVAFARDFAVLVADPRNHRVLRFSPFGKRIGVLGGERGPGATERVGVLDRPHAVAWRDDVTYVACGDVRLDFGVQRFGPGDAALQPLRSHGVAGRRFGAPRALLATEVALWVADTLEGSVQRFAGDGGFRHSFRTAPAGETGRPIGLARGAGGTLWVLDAGDRPALRCFDPSGHLVAERALAALELEHGAGIATDAAGRLLVLDHDGDRLNLCDAGAGAVLWRVELVEYLDRG